MPSSNRPASWCSTSRQACSTRASTTRPTAPRCTRSEEHTSELQSLRHLVCRLLLEKKKKETRHGRQPHSSRAAPPSKRCSAAAIRPNKNEDTHASETCTKRTNPTTPHAPKARTQSW